MLELARLFCARKNSLNVWIVFFDGEEAQGNWTEAPAFNGKTIVANTLSAAAKWPLKWRSPVN